MSPRRSFVMAGAVVTWKATTISGKYGSNVSGVLEGAIFANSDANTAELLPF